MIKHTKAEIDALIVAVQAGDPDAFGLLCEAIYGKAMIICRSVTGDYHEAADVCQEVFIRLQKVIPGLKPPYSLSLYIARMASGIRVNRHRKSKRCKFVDHEILDAFHNRKSKSPLDELITKETRRRVAEVINTLALRDLYYVRSLYGLGFSVKETATNIGVDQIVVRNRMQVLRPRITMMLEAAGLGKKER